jgi:hypothetical protein
MSSCTTCLPVSSFHVIFVEIISYASFRSCGVKPKLTWLSQTKARHEFSVDMCVIFIHSFKLYIFSYCCSVGNQLNPFVQVQRLCSLGFPLSRRRQLPARPRRLLPLANCQMLAENIKLFSLPLAQLSIHYQVHPLLLAHCCSQRPCKENTHAFLCWFYGLHRASLPHGRQILIGHATTCMSFQVPQNWLC